MSGNRIEEGSVTPNPAAASTLSSRRNGDIKEYFFNSGFTAQGNNPDKEIYNLAEARFGAKWVSVVRVVSSLITPISNTQTAQPSIRDVIFGFFHFAPRNKAAMAISFGTSTSYSLILARAFLDVRNLTNPHALVLVFTVGCYCAFQSVLQKYKRDLSS